MPDPKDTKKDELTDEQLESTAGAGPPPSDKVLAPAPHTYAQESELNDSQLDKASGGGPSLPHYGDERKPQPIITLDDELTDAQLNSASGGAGTSSTADADAGNTEESTLPPVDPVPPASYSKPTLDRPS